VALALAIGKVPTPVIATVTEPGAQLALLAYRTLKVTDVALVPDPGVAAPPERVTACDAPLQLAARTGVAAGSSTIRVATTQHAIRLIMVWTASPR
jgi:hypothetical protein